MVLHNRLWVVYALQQVVMSGQITTYYCSDPSAALLPLGVAPEYTPVELLIQLVTYSIGQHLPPHSAVYLKDIYQPEPYRTMMPSIQILY